MTRRGFTMLEVVIASFLVSLLALTTAAAFRYYNPAIFGLRDRTRAVTELRMSVEYLLQDLGGADTALPTEDDGLLIRRLPEVAQLEGGWESGEDHGVEYFLDGGRLIRRDVRPDTHVVVALDLTEFSVTQPDGEETWVHLEAGEGLGRRTMTLKWSPTGE